MNENEEHKPVRLSGSLRTYMQWPIILAILLIVANILCLVLNRQVGLVLGVFVVIYLIVAITLYVYGRGRVMQDLIEFATQYGVVQNTLLKELSIPYAIFLPDGKVAWMNDEFKDLLGENADRNTLISQYIPELNKNIFPRGDNEIANIDVYYEDKEYKAELRQVPVSEFAQAENLMEMPAKQEYFVSVSLLDVTELNEYIKINEAQRLVAGLIYIDNY